MCQRFLLVSGCYAPTKICWDQALQGMWRKRRSKQAGTSMGSIPCSAWFACQFTFHLVFNTAEPVTRSKRFQNSFFSCGKVGYLTFHFSMFLLPQNFLIELFHQPRSQEPRERSWERGCLTMMGAFRHTPTSH